MPFSLRNCIQSFIGDRTLNDVDLAVQLKHCLENYNQERRLAYDRDELDLGGPAEARVDPYDSIQRGDTEEYNPDGETNEQQNQPDQMTGGKKTRRRRHRHKSRRNRRKSHKRK